MTEDEYSKGQIVNLDYQRMLHPSCLKDMIDYLDFLINFYSSAINDLEKQKFEDEFQENMSISIRMIFTKAKMFKTLIVDFLKSFAINPQSRITIDHTILFTIVRSTYEQLCAFELIYIIPDTDDKKQILKNAYIASGLVNRRKLFTKEELKRNEAVLNEELTTICECKKNIQATSLYQSLDKKSQQSLDKEIFKDGHFQLYFDDVNHLELHVGWDKVRKYCTLDTDVLTGLYKYVCNMAHPSYLGLIQYNEALKTGNSTCLVTAIRLLSSIMSVFIMDYMTKFPFVKHLYENMDLESQYMICWYTHALRSKSKSIDFDKK